MYNEKEFEMRKFVLKVKYGTGKAAMLVDTPDLVLAIQQFKDRVGKSIPNTKDYGLPEITKAEIMPIMYDSVYDLKEDID